MPRLARLQSEMHFHDDQAAQRARDLACRSLRFTDDEYLDHESWIRPAFDRLGELRGRRVLDLGCGHGMAAIVMARRGARATGLDLSTGYLREARQRAHANEVDVAWIAADAEHLPFADNSFDCIWGNAVLHHLDLDQVGRELRRVLRPDGRAVFCEPWGGNPILSLARRRLPYPNKSRTPDEAPLDRDGVARLRRHFPKMKLEGHQLLAMVGRVVGSRPWLARWDARVLRNVPCLQSWCRYMILNIGNTTCNADNSKVIRPIFHSPSEHFVDS